MAQYKSLIEKIYASGGRKFLFLNVPPTSRSPKLIADGTSAATAHAKWVTAYNDALKTMVDEFNSENSGVRFNCRLSLYRTTNRATDDHCSL